MPPAAVERLRPASRRDRARSRERALSALRRRARAYVLAPLRLTRRGADNWTSPGSTLKDPCTKRLDRNGDRREPSLSEGSLLFVVERAVLIMRYDVAVVG